MVQFSLLLFQYLNVSTHVKNDLLYSSEELVVRSIKRIAYDDYTMMVGERYRD